MSEGAKTLIKCLFSAAVGAGIGAGVCYIFESRKFQRQMDAEFEEITKRRESSLGEQRSEKVEKGEEADMTSGHPEYDKIVNDLIKTLPPKAQEEIGDRECQILDVVVGDELNSYLSKGYKVKGFNYYIDDGLLTEEETDEPVDHYILGDGLDLETMFLNEAEQGSSTLYLVDNNLLVIYKVTGINT